jgi:F0F1-type ATP synthase membrane subunit c/vacuolar-type H+-ATPase subunit K
MTSDPSDTDTPTIDTANPTAESPETRSLASNKALWAGIGIGSAALVAALMYARRPKRAKR